MNVVFITFLLKIRLYHFDVKRIASILLKNLNSWLACKTYKNLKILITVNLIFIEYYNSKNEIIKLYKNISVEEYFSFRFLTEDNKWIYDLGKVYGSGEFKTGKYESCGFISHIVEYEYKVGKWKFWNLERKLIAEGEFVTDSSVVIGQSGCNYYIKTSKMRKENWKFYNSENKNIEPKIEELFILENANK